MEPAHQVERRNRTNDQVDVDTKDNQNNLVMMRQITRETRITKEKDNEKDDLGMTGGMKTDEKR